MPLTVNRNRFSLWLVRASIGAYATSFALPAYTTDYYGRLQVHLGLEAFLLGPIGLFAAHFSWLANLFLWFAWGKRTGSNTGRSLVFAVIALMLALSFLLPERIAVGSAGERPYSAGPGYYLWLCSIALAAVSAHLYEEHAHKPLPPGAA